MPTRVNNDAEALELLDSYERRGRAFMLQDSQNNPVSSKPVPRGTDFSSHFRK